MNRAAARPASTVPGSRTAATDRSTGTDTARCRAPSAAGSAACTSAVAGCVPPLGDLPRTSAAREVQSVSRVVAGRALFGMAQATPEDHQTLLRAIVHIALDRGTLLVNRPHLAGRLRPSVLRCPAQLRPRAGQLQRPVRHAWTLSHPRPAPRGARAVPVGPLSAQCADPAMPAPPRRSALGGHPCIGNDSVGEVTRAISPSEVRSEPLTREDQNTLPAAM